MSKCIIVGAGAAGLYAAGTALQAGASVSIVEHMPSPGRKLLITGKGRCNLTNNCDAQEFLRNVRSNPRFLYSALYALPPAAVMDVFSTELSLPLKTERGRRVFPESDRAEDVLDALLQRAKEAEFVKGEATDLLIEDGRVTGVRLASGQEMHADAVLLATGGLSYQITGSKGGGYTLAKQAGHSIKAPMPSLVSILTQGDAARRMAGLALKNVNLTLMENGKPIFSEQGEMLFTHFGVSGPLVLSASAYLGDMRKKRYKLVIDLKPALGVEQLDARVLRDFAQEPNKSAPNALARLVPASMRPVVQELWGLAPERQVNSVTRVERLRLVEILKNFCMDVSGRGDLAHAVITSGGVNVGEVDPKTMQSKKVQGLYFAGEILDVDAYTGGYNLHIAWCTGHAAGKSMQK